MVPEVCLAQVLPPFVVTTIVPEAPTDQQSLLLTHDVAYRSFVVPDVWTVQEEAKAGVASATSVARTRADVPRSRRSRDGLIHARAETPAMLSSSAPQPGT